MLRLPDARASGPVLGRKHLAPDQPNGLPSCSREIHLPVGMISIQSNFSLGGEKAHRRTRGQLDSSAIGV